MRANANKIAGLMVVMLTLLVGGLSQVEAAIIFDNIGPGDFYYPNDGWPVGAAYADILPDLEFGNGFLVSGGNFSLDKVEAGVGLFSGANELELRLMTDVGGFPDAILEAFEFNGVMGPMGSINPLLVADSIGHPALTDGRYYWLVASAPDPTTIAYWNLGGSVGGTIFRSADGPWQSFGGTTQSAFRLSGTPITASSPIVPEPSSLFLLGPFLLGLTGWYQRRFL